MAPAAPQSSSTNLSESPVVYASSVPEQTYDLYLDAATSETGGQGSITTIEPSAGQEEGSAIDGLEFRSAEMISDLYVNGTGASDTARLSVYIQFRGTDGSTADVTFSLKAGDTQISSESRNLEDPCTSSNPFGGGCSWSVIEVEFDVGSSGFVVPKGKQLKIRIDAQATCDGQTGGLTGGDCAVDIAFGKMESSGGYSRLQVMTNALSGSSVRVHSCNAEFGCNWNDAQKTEWSPNHRPEFREMQFSVEVRDAFGREDIDEVNLVMDTPNGANAVFDHNFEDDDFKLDNNGLVGNFTYTYDAGIAAGEYPLRLEVEDVQGHSVIFEHPGITMLEHDIYLTLPSNQPDTVLFAPGAVVQVEFLVEHTGASSSSIDVIFDLETNLPNTWSDPNGAHPAAPTPLTAAVHLFSQNCKSKSQKMILTMLQIRWRSRPGCTLRTAKAKAKKSPFVRFRSISKKWTCLHRLDCLSTRTMSIRNKSQIPHAPKPMTKHCRTTSMQTKWVISTSTCSTRASKRTRSK